MPSSGYSSFEEEMRDDIEREKGKRKKTSKRTTEARSGKKKGNDDGEAVNGKGKGKQMVVHDVDQDEDGGDSRLRKRGRRKKGAKRKRPDLQEPNVILDLLGISKNTLLSEDDSSYDEDEDAGRPQPLRPRHLGTGSRDQEDSETELEEDELSPQNQMELDPEETIFQRAKRMESLKKKVQAVPPEDEETESEEESMHERAKRRIAEKAQRRLAESSKNGQVRDGSQSASQGSAIQRSSIQAVARPVSAHVRSGKDQSGRRSRETTPIQAPTPPPSLPTFPRRQDEHFRPDFMIKDAAQAAIGPLVLDAEESIEVPACIARFLRSYQIEGVKFLYEHYKKGEGGILGDDMGLGKTIQVISFLAAIMKKTGHKDDLQRRRNLMKAGKPKRPSDLGATCLIVCPTSVLYNWKRELDTWGYFTAEIFRGFREEKRSIRESFAAGNYDILLCGHDMARKEIEALSLLDFTCVVVDECHKIKNPEASTTKAYMRFNTLRRYGLTGTAMQNQHEEFWCILNWAFPEKLGFKYQWAKYVVQSLKRGQKQNASAPELARGRLVAERLVTKVLPQFFLRRTKNLIQDQLPTKQDKVVFCPLTQDQLRGYKKLLASDEVQEIVKARDPCGCGAVDETGRPYMRSKCCYTALYDDDTWTRKILKWITVFLKVSNHLCLIYPNREDFRGKEEKYEMDCGLVKQAFPEDYMNRTWSYRNNKNPNLCGKWKVLEDFLKTWKKAGDKVLIFSSSVRLLNMVDAFMAMTYNAEYLRLDGSTNVEERLPMCDKFNRDPDVFAFLISTKAGGTGLNLTGANKVVVFDPNWNPAHDLQAIDRSFRLGQTRDVEAYRLVGAGSLEELVYSRQIYKQQQANIMYTASHERRYFRGVQGDSADQGELFGVKNLFKLQERGTITQKAIEDCDMTELQYALLNLGLADNEDELGPPSKSETDEDEESTVKKPMDRKARAVLEALINPQRPAQEKKDDKPNPIDQILAANGISYAHSNSAVAGSSKIEQKISEDAIRRYKHRKEEQQPARKRPKVKEEPREFIAPVRGSKARRHSELTNTSRNPSIKQEEDEDIKSNIKIEFNEAQMDEEMHVELETKALIHLPNLVKNGRDMERMAQQLGFRDPPAMASALSGMQKAEAEAFVRRFREEAAKLGLLAPRRF